MDGCVIKIDGDGEVIWSQTYGEDQGQHFYDIVVAPAGYAMCGTTDTVQTLDAWLVRIEDEEGEEVWQETYGDEEATERTLGLVLTDDNGVALAGQSRSGR